MKKKLGRNETAENIVAVTVKYIDDNNGLQGLTLRTIAKMANCAHTNVYNYFEDFNDLLWTAYSQILLHWIEYVEQYDFNIDKPIDAYTKFISVQVDFALQHPGWYRYIWLEPTPDSLPETILAKFAVLQKQFEDIIYNAADTDLEHKKISTIETIIHSYCHGEICKLLYDKNIIKGNDEYKKFIVANCTSLLTILTTNEAVSIVNSNYTSSN